MKLKYIIVISMVLCAAVVGELLVVVSPLETHDRFIMAMQIAGACTFLLTGVIAVSAADPKIKAVDLTVDSRGNEAGCTMRLPGSVKAPGRDVPREKGCDRTVRGVRFKRITMSGFTLIKQTVTVRLPFQKQHPPAC